MSEIGQKLLILPISLVLIWLVYRGFKPGLKLHIWFGLYVFGHISLYSIFVSLLWTAGLSVNAVNYLTMLVSIVYWIFAAGQFYQLSIGRSIGLGLLYYIIYLLLFSFIGGLFGVYVGFQLASDMG